MGFKTFLFSFLKSDLHHREKDTIMRSSHVTSAFAFFFALIFSVLENSTVKCDHLFGQTLFVAFDANADILCVKALYFLCSLLDKWTEYTITCNF